MPFDLTTKYTLFDLLSLLGQCLLDFVKMYRETRSFIRIFPNIGVLCSLQIKDVCIILMSLFECLDHVHQLNMSTKNRTSYRETGRMPGAKELSELCCTDGTDKDVHG